MSKTRIISLTALMIALNVSANGLASIFTLKIPVFGVPSLVYATAFLSGIWLGPVWGGLASLFGDVIGFFLFPSGVWIWQITLSSTLMGVIAGLIFRCRIKSLPLKITIVCVLTLIICTLLNSWGLSVYCFDSFPSAQARGEKLGITSPFVMILIAKLITQPFWIALNGLLTFMILINTKNVVEAFKNNK